MVYDRNSRNTPQDDYYRRSETQDYGRDYGAGEGYSSARSYQAAGYYDRGRDDNRSDWDRGYGRRDFGRDDGYGREQGYGRNDQGEHWRRQGQDRQDYGRQDYGRQDYGQRGSYGQSRYAQGDEFHGSYASDRGEYGRSDSGRGYGDARYGHQGYGNQQGYGSQHSYGAQRSGRGDYGRAPQGYDYQDRGFVARAGDEVRSWFGDEDAERRREMDNRFDERYANERDSDYHSWRTGQIAAFDRDYDEYRRENRSRFESEFSTWRTTRQGQRDLLGKVKEHAEVLGSDGAHVGTVDKVRGDRILLTRTDADAGGQHHSIPSSWLTSADDKTVKLSKTADQAKQHWRSEEQNQALFGYGDDGQRRGGEQGNQGTNLNRSFSGTY